MYILKFWSFQLVRYRKISRIFLVQTFWQSKINITFLHILSKQKDAGPVNR